MKTKLLIILAIVMVISITESFAEEPSLKKQLAENTALSDISCPDENHILVKRSNDKLSCVAPYTMAKLEWSAVDNSLWTIVVKNEQPYGIFTHLSKTQNAESVKYNQDTNSVIVHVISDKSEKLSVNVNREILESGTENCLEMPSWDDYFVLINGEEVAYETRLTTDYYQYLELEIDSNQNMPSQMLSHVSNLHKFRGIPFQENSMIIEIVGACLI